MSAEALGKRLLGEVKEERLNEVRDINAMKEQFMLMHTMLATMLSPPPSRVLSAVPTTYPSARSPA
jgi:hypothetical protein